MKIAVLLSGGVDSSYTAFSLKEQGHELVGIYLKLHASEKKHDLYIKNAQKACEFLGIPLEVLDFQKDFKSAVYDEFISAYEKGQTPNPCALCNPLMKFGLALDYALKLGCEKIATGHYARVKEIDKISYIQEAFDKSKDQSYFLYALSHEVIAKLVFPLGGLLKNDIKPLALKAMPFLGTLETYKESQEICFVEKSYIDTLKKHVEVEKEGVVKNLQGEIIGSHKGYMQYTIGKRKGFNIKGAHTPHFVLKIDAKNNELVVGKKEDLATHFLKATNKSLMKDFKSGEYLVKARYRSMPTKAFVSLKGEIIEVEFKEPFYGVASGQALVVYENDVVLGGGVII
ncbi:tRNA 2-thiouridine(34) synthase MnmA [Helicobacter cetorum]|uniref:tRNA 2-thiouridine(34) synthase MnmA n=1 Tax=Helicobacter cetorum TaxID=138563 RepID=UPI000CF08748|nr:tRNA 2-thiouridine(34) synthase MnmA [Helicobacter cetorum]